MGHRDDFSGTRHASDSIVGFDRTRASQLMMRQCSDRVGLRSVSTVATPVASETSTQTHAEAQLSPAYTPLHGYITKSFILRIVWELWTSLSLFSLLRSSPDTVLGGTSKLDTRLRTRQASQTSIHQLFEFRPVLKAYLGYPFAIRPSLPTACRSSNAFRLILASFIKRLRSHLRQRKHYVIVSWV